MVIRIVNIKKGSGENGNPAMPIFILSVAGLFDMDRGDDVRIVLKTLVSGGARKILLDMEGLDFIDSAGIGVIITAANLVRGLGGNMALVNVPYTIAAIMKPLNIKRFINSFKNLHEAINFFRI